MTVAGKRIAEVPFMQAYRPIGDNLANNKKQKCISQRGWQETPCTLVSIILLQSPIVCMGLGYFSISNMSHISSDFSKAGLVVSEYFQTKLLAIIRTFLVQSNWFQPVTARNLQEQSGNAHFSLMDTSIGVSPPIQSTIFEQCLHCVKQEMSIISDNDFSEC